MSAKNLATFGIYGDQVSACEAVDELKRVGFRSTDTSILLQDNLGSKDMGLEKHTKAPEGAAMGAVVGAVIGFALGWLLGTGTFGTISWILPFTGVEPIGTALSGLGAGSLFGLIIGALAGSSIPEYEAKRYAGRIRHAGILLSVHCDNMDWTKRAKDILRQTGAKGIAVGSEEKADFRGSEKPLPRTRTATILPRTNPPVVDADSKAPVVDPAKGAFVLPDGSDDDARYISPRKNPEV